jgi:hypothetical protein
MALIPEAQRRDVVRDLTERILEDYYLERGFTIPERSYILHDRQTDEEDMQQLHPLVVLPGTTPSIVDRLPVYNSKSERHDKLFREIATQHFSDMGYYCNH